MKKWISASIVVVGILLALSYVKSFKVVSASNSAELLIEFEVCQDSNVPEPDRIKACTKYINQSDETDARHQSALHKRGMANHRVEQYDEAITDFKKSLTISAEKYAPMSQLMIASSELALLLYEDAANSYIQIMQNGFQNEAFMSVAAQIDYYEYLTFVWNGLWQTVFLSQDQKIADLVFDAIGEYELSDALHAYFDYQLMEQNASKKTALTFLANRIEDHGTLDFDGRFMLFRHFFTICRNDQTDCPNLRGNLDILSKYLETMTCAQAVANIRKTSNEPEMSAIPSDKGLDDVVFASLFFVENIGDFFLSPSTFEFRQILHLEKLMRCYERDEIESGIDGVSGQEIHDDFSEIVNAHSRGSVVAFASYYID